MKCVHRTTRTYPHSNCPFNSPPDSSESEIEKWKRKHEEQRREYDQSEFVGGSLAIATTRLQPNHSQSPIGTITNEVDCAEDSQGLGRNCFC